MANEVEERDVHPELYEHEAKTKTKASGIQGMSAANAFWDEVGEMPALNRYMGNAATAA